MDLLENPVASAALLPAVATALERARADSDPSRRGLRGRYVTLTRRERQVFALVTASLLNKQVGFELGTSEKTVKVQRARVIVKMGARSLVDLVRMADWLGVSAGDGGEEGPLDHVEQLRRLDDGVPLEAPAAAAVTAVAGPGGCCPR